MSATRRGPVPMTVRAALAIAEDHARKIDASDSDLQEMAFTTIWCTRALLIALEHDAADGRGQAGHGTERLGAAGLGVARRGHINEPKKRGNTTND